MSERVRMCGGTWRYCDRDCKNCHKTYATNTTTTTTISKEQLYEIKPPIVTKEQLAEMLGIVKHGHWIFVEQKDENESWYKCSECDAFDLHVKDAEIPFCWACGAKMDGERKQDDE